MSKRIISIILTLLLVVSLGTASGFSAAKCRFYFDPELYKRKYEELHGVPYTGNKSFRKTKTRKKRQ